MLKKKDSFHKSSRILRGQSLIEFALVLPVLLLLVLGSIDIGRMFYTKIVLTNAAREGANYLALKRECTADTTPTFTSDSLSNALSAIKAEGLSSNVVIDDGDWDHSNLCEPGVPVQVTVTKTVDLIFDGVLQTFGLLNGPIELNSTIEMVIQ